MTENKFEKGTHKENILSHSLRELFSDPYLLKLPKMKNAVDLLATRTLTVKLVDSTSELPNS